MGNIPREMECLDTLTDRYTIFPATKGLLSRAASLIGVTTIVGVCMVGAASLIGAVSYSVFNTTTYYSTAADGYICVDE